LSLARNTARLGIALLFFATLVLVAPPARAQRPGLLRELRDRLSFRSAEEIWDAASRLVDAEEAAAVMEDLSERQRGPGPASRAALWMGHYHYGAGRLESALGFFERAQELDGPAEIAAEAGFWSAQCRNLLGLDPRASSGRREGASPVLERIVISDGELRMGDLRGALRGYLALEGDARQAGVLGPLLYRVALVHSTAAGERNLAGGLDRATLRLWETATPASPERALAAALLGPAGSPTGPPASGSPDSPRSSRPPEKPDGSGAQDPGFGGGAAPGPGVAGPEGSGLYSVQAGAFASPAGAAERAELLRARGADARIDQEDGLDGTLYKVRFGRVASRPEADALGRRYCEGMQWQIVRLTR